MPFDRNQIAKRVIIAMEHTSKNGEPKLVANCDLPLTGKGVVNMIVTDLAVIEVTPDGFLLKEVAPGVTEEEVIAKTGAPLKVDPQLKRLTTV
jgi:3-oxoacid CoA-transferase subunit B